MVRHGAHVTLVARGCEIDRLSGRPRVADQRQNTFIIGKMRGLDRSFAGNLSFQLRLPARQRRGQRENTQRICA